MLLILDQTKIQGKFYHTVRPKDYQNWMEIEVWAHKVYGPASNVWKIVEADEHGGRWYVNNGRFWFRDQRDITTFLLRWSSH